MKNELNFLYCLDKNYNIQTNVSIYSLLQNINQKINLFVIHQQLNTFKIPSKITEHLNLKSLSLFEFKKGDYKFPKVEGAHVSEATYYRFFIEEHLPKNVKNLIYLDADILTINDPIDLINNQFNKMNKSEFFISVRSENETENKNLKLSNSKYFNAGVMLINYEKWLKNNMLNDLLEITRLREKDIVFWDQDVLNILFDGNYIELSKSLNYKLEPSHKIINTNEDNDTAIKFIHYSGKFKPWSLKGIQNNFSIRYQDVYRDLYDKKYHLADNWKGNTLKDLIRLIFTGKIFLISFPYSLLMTIFKFLFKNKK